MKRIISMLLTIVLFISLAARDARASESKDSAATSLTPELRGTVVFTDPILEAMVRGTMGRPDGAIPAAEAAAVTRVDLSADWEQYASEWMPIKDLGGLEYFTGLESLDLSGHAITDIRPLANLSKLTTLALGGNPIADIEALAGLTSLKMLILTGCAAQDYSPLAKLHGLEFLMLNNSTIADAAPLAALTKLERLYLKGCKLSYSPLAKIYPNLIDKDFTMATALAEYGFYMDGAQAIYDDAERVSVRINHLEWGAPMAMGAANCVRTVFKKDDYKVDIGYYPEHDAYVIQAYQNGEFVVNYVYSVADGSVNVSAEDRERYEAQLRAIFPDAAGGDLLLEPINYYNAALKDALGMTANELYALPFAPPTLEGFGFFLREGTEACEYHEHEPHDTHISIYRPEWGESRDGRSVEFYDDDVGGYSLLLLYFANEGKYSVSLFKDSKECAYDIYPDRNEYGGEYPDTETVRGVLSIAFGTQEEEMYTEPLVHLKKFLLERFDMSIDELYALPER